jgi:WW domain-containing oxidoreductase
MSRQMPKTPFGARSTADDVLRGVSLTNKTILVTGCNGGIGFETMRALAAHGAHIIGTARTLEGARTACVKAGGSTTAIGCDLGTFSSITAAIEEVRALGRPLDVIITNAGIMCPKTLELKSGIEHQFFVNHVGHFLLVNRLLDLVPDRTGRIVVISSSASIQQAPREGIMFDNLDGNRSYQPFVFYGQSKLANALFAKELSGRLGRRGIAVNSLHPGAVGGTGLQRHLRFPFNLIMPVASLFMKSVSQGAATQVLLAGSPLVEGVTGEYWADCNISKGSKWLAQAGIAQRLWSVTEEIIGSRLKATARG